MSDKPQPEKFSEAYEYARQTLNDELPYGESWYFIADAYTELFEQYEVLNALHANGMFLGRPIEHWEGLQEQCAFVSGEYEDAKRELFDVCAERDNLKEQCEAYRSALEEVHDQFCGCDRPANPATCIAPEETWGAFALLKESNPASVPDGELATRQEPSAPGDASGGTRVSDSSGVGSPAERSDG